MNDPKKKVLVANENEDDLWLISAALQILGYETIEARNGKEALEAAGHQKTDFIILDTKMSDMHGFEVCWRLKKDQRTKSIPVLVVHSTDDRASKEMSWKAGANALLKSPAGAHEIIRLIEKLSRSPQHA
jgi:CheY-like chemotaxis protein